MHPRILLVQTLVTPPVIGRSGLGFMEKDDGRAGKRRSTFCHFGHFSTAEKKKSHTRAGAALVDIGGREESGGLAAADPRIMLRHLTHVTSVALLVCLGPASARASGRPRGVLSDSVDICEETCRPTRRHKPSRMPHKGGHSDHIYLLSLCVDGRYTPADLQIGISQMKPSGNGRGL